jgi:deoxyribodipyrimidine photo-lyase
MLQSLEELADAYDGKLSFFYGDTAAIIDRIGPAVIYETADYTPYAKKRTEEIHSLAEDNNIEYYTIDDIYLNAPGSVLNRGGKPYQKFTPYYEEAMKRAVAKPSGPARGPFARVGGGQSLAKIVEKIGGDRGIARAYQGGRREALELLKAIPSNYAEIHDVLAEQTSGLSVHHHYGTVSIRESYWAGKKKGTDAFIRQLYWRDFYGQIVAFFEDLYGVGAYEFQTGARYESLSAAKAKVLKAWKEGKTGVPLVDAAMRQMNETGFMHNRARLVVASWLVKDMGIWWRWGERYFAERLLDYDFSQNFGNWCWVASVLPFSQPPFRRHDPVSIAKRLDADGVYVSRWLEE